MSAPIPTTRLDRFVAKYRQDHRHPVNHVLHVYAGWPLVALAVVLLPFRPLWSLGLFLGGYVLMFFGHCASEKNTPTIPTHPSAPVIIAWAVVRGLGAGLSRLAPPQRGR